MPKKNNPGCNCCGGEDCTTRCLYKCTGTPCPSACAIQIDTPLPDTVSTTSGPTCPEQECSIIAECNMCRRLFDGLFHLDTERTRLEWKVEGSGSCESYQITYTPDLFASNNSFYCWTWDNYLCPDETFGLRPIPCEPQYNIKDPMVVIRIDYDGTCSTTEVEISYTVYESCNALAVPPNPLTDPETQYVHLFRRIDQCNCADVLGVLSFVSTTSTNNWRGITVPDVCNIDAATVSLVDTQICGCYCFFCQEPSNERTLTVTGDYAGTYVLNYVNSIKYPFCIEFITDDYCNSVCIFESSVFGSNQKWILWIECLPCEKFNIYLVLDGTPGFLDDFRSYAKALGVVCDSTITLDEVYEEGATYEVS